MYCDRYDKKRKECQLCNDAIKLYQVMVSAKGLFGERLGWKVVDAMFDRIARRRTTEEMQIITNKIDDFAMIGSINLN